MVIPIIVERKEKKMDLDIKVEVSGDIIYEIFLKLPTKSLLHFRSISMKCCDIIVSFAFANKHTSIQIAATTYEPQVLPLSNEFSWETMSIHLFMTVVSSRKVKIQFLLSTETSLGKAL